MKLIRNIVCFILFLLMMFGILYLSVPKVRQIADSFFSNIIKEDKITQTNNQIDFEVKTIKVEV